MISTKLKYISEINEIFNNHFGCCAENGIITNADRLHNQLFNIFDEISVEYFDLVKDLQKSSDNPNLLSGEKMNAIRKEMIDAIGDVQVFLFGGLHLAGLGDYKESKTFHNAQIIEDYTRLKNEISKLPSVIEKLKKIKVEIEKSTNNMLSFLKNGEATMNLEALVQEIDTICLVAYELLSTNGDLVIKSIAESNFSKVCYTEENLKESMEYYQDLGIKVHSVNIVAFGKKGFAVISSENQKDKNGKYYNKDKFLKSTNFVEPDQSIW